MTTGNWQALTKDWLNIHHNAKYEQRKQMVLDIQLMPNSTILDAGCGIGNFTKLFAQHPATPRHIIGMDISLPHLQIALNDVKDLGNEFTPLWICGDINHIPLYRYFDLVWCANTLQYFPRPSGIINLLANLVKNGGKLVVKDEDVIRDILISWDPEFELAIINAWYKIATNLEGQFWDPFIARRLFGLFQLPCFKNISVKTYLIEYTYPLPRTVQYYIYNAFVGYSKEYRKYLSRRHWKTFTKIFDPDSDEFLFKQTDIHFISTETVISAEVFHLYDDCFGLH